MQNNEEVARLLEVARDFRFAMLTTVADDQHLHARPMTIAALDEDEGSIWFLAAREHASVSELARDGRALVTMQSKDAYVQWSGHAEVVEDAMRLHELWQPSFATWFPKGPDEGKLVLIRVDVEVGEYWDQGGAMKLRTMLRRAKEAIQGRGEATESRPDERAHGRVRTSSNGRGA